MTIVSSDAPVTLIGGAGCATQDLETALTLAPRLVAADGGAAMALAAGYRPEAVIGDMDSLSAAGQSALSDHLHPITEQDSTDFDKAVRSIDAPLILAVGVSGGRLDHELAALSTLVGRPERRCIILGAETLTLHCPPSLTLDLPAGALVSLYPLKPVTMGCAGLRWSFDALDLAPDGRVGTSNAAMGGPATITASNPGLLVILRRAELAQAVSALTG